MKKISKTKIIFPSILFSIILAFSSSAKAATNDAQFLAQSVPTSMVAGQVYTVTVTIKNTGVSTWTMTSAYRLGSQNPYDNKTWGMSRIFLASGESISPGQQKVFTFDITAPARSGIYNFQWRMVQDGVEWFGDLSSNVAVQVNSSSLASSTLSVDFSKEAQNDFLGVNAVYHGFAFMPEQINKGMSDADRAREFDRVGRMELNIARTWYHPNYACGNSLWNACD